MSVDCGYGSSMRLVCCAAQPNLPARIADLRLQASLLLHGGSAAHLIPFARAALPVAHSWMLSCQCQPSPPCCCPALPWR